MLKAFKEQLRTLSVDPQDQFHFFIRKRIGKKATILLEKKLKQLILLTPGLVSRIYGLWASLKSPAQIKNAGGFLLTYMYHPKDFLPEETFGLFGYLDDAYFVAVVFEKLTQELKNQGIALTNQDERLAKDLTPLRKAARLVIKDEAKNIENMIEDILQGRREKFHVMFN